MLHSIFPSLLLWGMCKMRSSQYFMRSIPNSLCGLQADLELMVHCVLNRALWSEFRRHSHHISWAFAIQSSCKLGGKGEDLVVRLWLPAPWNLWEAWCLPAESSFSWCWQPSSSWSAPGIGEVVMQKSRHAPTDITASDPYRRVPKTGLW